MDKTAILAALPDLSPVELREVLAAVLKLSPDRPVKRDPGAWAAAAREYQQRELATRQG